MHVDRGRMPVRRGGRDDGRPRVVAVAAALTISLVLGACGSGSSVVSGRSARLDTRTTPTTAAPIDPADPVTTAWEPPAGQVPNGAPSETPMPTTPAVDPTPDAAPAAFALAPFTVSDPMLSGQQAFTVLVPQGWQASGEVQWLPFWSRQAFLQTRVLDPASGLTIDWLPIQDFMWFTPPGGFEVPVGGNYQGKEYRPPIFDPVQFVQEFWMGGDLAHLQNATVVFVEDQPAVAQAFLDGFGGTGDAGAWRIRYEYTFQGVVWEQDVSFGLLWSGTDPMSWYVNFAVTAGAPKGELDRQAGLVSAVIASRTTAVSWEADYRLVQQLFYQGIRQQMADTQRLVDLLAQYRAESQALQQQVFDERMASQDRRNEVFRETLGGVEGYIDPVNQVIVQLPLGGDTYWVNEAGEYLVVTDPNFDPNSMNDGSWTELSPRG